MNPRNSKKKTAVIGAGSWGTALAILLAEKGEDVFLWGRNSHHLQQMADERENRKYLPGANFPQELSICASLEGAVRHADCIVMAVPSHGYRQVFREIVHYLKETAIVVSVVKGIEIGTRMTMTQIMEDELGPSNTNHLGVLSGPSFAEEVAAGQPTAITVAFKDERVAEEVQHLFSTSYFRVYSSTDVAGLEICGAMKNIIAIAAGIGDGLGYGLNSRAALITRGLAEISRMGVAMGADSATFAGLGGLGDLVLTCTGNLSRNRTVGLKLGEGKTLQQCLDEMTMVAEGVKTTKSCFNLAKELGVDVPILEQVYKVLYEDKNCRDAVHDLFSRDLKKEVN